VTLYKKIITAVSFMLFSSLALVVNVVSEIHETGFPTKLDAKWTVNLDFENSGLTDQQAFDQLGELDERLDLGLHKIAPDLDRPGAGEVFVALRSQQNLPQAFARYGGPDGTVIAPDYLQNSFATGRYLLANDNQQATMQRWLAEKKIKAEWTQDDLSNSLRLFIQGGFAPSLIAALALLMAMSLFWLSIRARGRALRVLAGVPTWKISGQDLFSLAIRVALGGVFALILGIGIVSVREGISLTGYFAQTLGLCVPLFTLLTVGCGALLSLKAWPSSEMLARRKPAAGSMRGVALAVRVVIFAIVAAAIGPAVTAFSEARYLAQNLAVWNSLADQAGLSFVVGSGNGDSEMAATAGALGKVIAAARKTDAVSLSVAWDTKKADFASTNDFGRHESLAIVSQSWLRLIRRADDPGLRRIPATAIAPEAEEFLDAQWELLARDGEPSHEKNSNLSFYEFSGSRPLPVSDVGGASLDFLNRALVIVIDDIHLAVNDETLAAFSTGANITFTDLDKTQRLISASGISKNWRVVRAAEEGVLAAQYAKYFAWLRALATMSLIVALVITTAVGAFISAVVQARHDFPLRIFGRSWWDILQWRILRESWAVVGIGWVVALLQSSQNIYVALVTALAIAIIYVAHLRAASWTFHQIAHRNF
jgi:hypothetical protein